MKTRTKKLIDSIAMALVFIARPLRSRKVRTLIAGAASAYLADVGLDASPVVIGGIITFFTALIMGTAIEDHGTKRRSSILDHYPKKTTSPDGREINRGAQT